MHSILNGGFQYKLYLISTTVIQKNNRTLLTNPVLLVMPRYIFTTVCQIRWLTVHKIGHCTLKDKWHGRMLLFFQMLFYTKKARFLIQLKNYKKIARKKIRIHFSYQFTFGNWSFMCCFMEFLLILWHAWWKRIMRI